MSILSSSFHRPPKGMTVPLPDRAEVVVLGAGLSGLAIAGRLQDEGAYTVVLEAKEAPAAGMASRGMGIASTLLLDPPFRLIEALGLETATDVLRFSREGVDAWGDALVPCGVAYASKGPREHAEVELNLEALARLGLAARAWTPESASELSPGWHQPSGGTLNLEKESERLSAGIPIITEAQAIGIEDDGLDLSVHLADGRRIRADLVVMSGGAQITAWARDKFHPVRHQAIATETLPTLLDVPIHAQYGYTTIRQLSGGELMISGCRWATPHLEVGETDDTFVHPDVHARLIGFLRQHWPQCAQARISHQWSSIMTFSCDGLPVIGPLPGRPRIISCGGFGGFSPSLALRAARAVTDGILTGESEGVPSCFTTQRFE
jgi:sarcosine oxidase subunit beta